MCHDKGLVVPLTDQNTTDRWGSTIRPIRLTDARIRQGYGQYLSCDQSYIVGGLCCFHRTIWGLSLQWLGGHSRERAPSVPCGHRAFFRAVLVFRYESPVGWLAELPGTPQPKKIAERVFVGEVQSHSREYGMAWHDSSDRW